MWFGRKRAAQDGTILAADGQKLDLVSSYKYLGVWIDSSLSFSEHLSLLHSKVKARLSFLYRNRSLFTASAKRSLLHLTVLSLFDHGDAIYRSACKGALERLNVLHHSAIRFETNAPYRTHHCDLYTLANWPPLEIRCNIHWLMLVFKALLGLTPPYLTQLLHLRPPTPHTHYTRSAPLILLNAPRAYSSLGHSSFQFAAADSWNQLQKYLQLRTFTAVSSFKYSHNKIHKVYLQLSQPKLSLILSRSPAPSLPSAIAVWYHVTLSYGCLVSLSIRHCCLSNQLSLCRCHCCMSN